MEIEVGSEVAKLYGAVRGAPWATSTFEGVEYFFCSDENRKNFIK